MVWLADWISLVQGTSLFFSLSGCRWTCWFHISGIHHITCTSRFYPPPYPIDCEYSPQTVDLAFTALLLKHTEHDSVREGILLAREWMMRELE